MWIVLGIVVSIALAAVICMPDKMPWKGRKKK